MEGVGLGLVHELPPHCHLFESDVPQVGAFPRKGLSVGGLAVPR